MSKLPQDSDKFEYNTTLSRNSVCGTDHVSGMSSSQPDSNIQEPEVQGSQDDMSGQMLTGDASSNIFRLQDSLLTPINHSPAETKLDQSTGDTEDQLICCPGVHSGYWYGGKKKKRCIRGTLNSNPHYLLSHGTSGTAWAANSTAIFQCTKGRCDALRIIWTQNALQACRDVLKAHDDLEGYTRVQQKFIMTGFGRGIAGFTEMISDGWYDLPVSSYRNLYEGVIQGVPQWPEAQYWINQVRNGRHQPVSRQSISTSNEPELQMSPNDMSGQTSSNPSNYLLESIVSFGGLAERQASDELPNTQAYDINDDLDTFPTQSRQSSTPDDPATGIRNCIASTIRAWDESTGRPRFRGAEHDFYILKCPKSEGPMVYRCFKPKCPVQVSQLALTENQLLAMDRLKEPHSAYTRQSQKEMWREFDELSKNLRIGRADRTDVTVDEYMNLLVGIMQSAERSEKAASWGEGRYTTKEGKPMAQMREGG